MSADEKGHLRGISRRSFLASGTLAAAGAAGAQGGPGGKAAAHSGGDSSFELNEITISELQAGLKSGKFTARLLTEKYLARIEAMDKGGAAVHSVIELNPEALQIAQALDAEWKAKGARGP